MQNFRIPEIAPLYYCGQEVFTTKQLSEFFKRTRQTLDGIFRKHKAEFVEGVDYFLLTAEKLQTFKATFNGQVGLLTAETVDLLALPFSNIASKLYIWTKSGALKFSQYLGTDEAKTIYTAFALGISTVTPNQAVKPSQKSENCCKVLDKFIAFLDKCAAITDENLREELIKKAIALI